MIHKKADAMSAFFMYVDEENYPEFPSRGMLSNRIALRPYGSPLYRPQKCRGPANDVRANSHL